MIVIAVLFTSCTGKTSHKRTRIGDGTHFYCEPIKIGSDSYGVQHSTLNCPKINKGVMRDSYNKKEVANIYCPECMTDELITIFIERHFPNDN